MKNIPFFLIIAQLIFILYSIFIEYDKGNILVGLVVLISLIVTTYELKKTNNKKQ